MVFIPVPGVKRVPKRLGIVGSEQAKFTPETEAKARGIIRNLLDNITITRVVSGGCHLGGVDIFAEEEAAAVGLEVRVHLPRNLQWSSGYAPRNMLIVRDSDEVHCITVRELPPGYKGMRFDRCYHCAKAGGEFSERPHVKSGGCWTMHKAIAAGKKGVLWVV